jgi:hypothetical protein
MKCEKCRVDVTDVQVAMKFRALPGGKDWEEIPVIAGVCTQCGKMDLHMATPQQFAGWISSQKNIK